MTRKNGLPRWTAQKSLVGPLQAVRGCMGLRLIEFCSKRACWYLRCREIAFEDLDQTLAPDEVWAALETLHRLPLTQLTETPWQEHKTAEQTLIFADRVGQDLIDHLRGVVDRRENAFVYVWALGQITSVITEGLDVRSVRGELVTRFRQ